jgi:outer membrane immunogenic protein
MKKLFLATSAIAFAGSASAADMPARMAMKAPVVAAIPFTWSGCYVGGHAGYGWGRENFNDPTGNFTAAPGGNLGVRSEGAIVGGQLGCNYQVASNWVIGVEGMGAWTDINGSSPDLVFGTKNLSSKTEALASVTGRLGYTVDHVMFYGKGGGAWARDRYQENTPGFAPFLIPPDVFTARVDRFGWTVGAGVEWAFTDNWSTRLEYNHYDFGTRSVNLTDAIGVIIPANVSQRIDTVTVGINYRFWTPASAVVARY